MAYEERFTGKADHYSAARPSYPEALIDALYQELGVTPDSVVADMGCGTGKFAACLLRRGTTVLGVEPNGDMRKKAEAALAQYPNFHSVPGNDSATGLGDESVDYITAAQAFHWFDPEKFREECNRIRKKEGKVFLIWNLRDLREPVNRDWEELFREFAPDFIGFNNGLVPDDPRIRRFFPGGYSYREFDNTLYFTQEVFRKRLLSSSYAPMEGDVRYEPFLARVDEIFRRYARDGVITVPHYTALYWG